MEDLHVEMRHYWTRIRFKYGYARNSIADKVNVSANISAEIISDLIDNVEKGSDSFSNSDFRGNMPTGSRFSSRVIRSRFVFENGSCFLRHSHRIT